ncbi:hypothetical protein LDBUL1632_01565 [Lactobacillus delbrueckii subsp. bulgaricus CNCM I-1632]|nr:hypothetical protein LDBUL1632_01565 [Lactobacillus delbrueckii subsp. bulgaricus CNCM I-1632]CUS17669.1 Amino acid permease [Lactobacillus delbrueckii subsp. bulgaricus]
MLMSAIGTFIPVFKGGSNLPSIIVAIIFCWALTFLVNNGVESASCVNTIGTFCKVVPLIMFVIICIVSFKGGMFTADFWGRVANNLSKGTTTGGLWPQMKGTLMTLIWIFIGVEGASVMGSRAKSLNEAQQATMLGFVLLLVFYMMISILPCSSLTRAQLASAAQPALGNDLKMIVGDWGMMIINIGLIISTIVSWLSWTMLPAETMLLIAEDGAAPKFWGKLNSKKAPTNALFTTAILQTIFLFSLLFTDKAYEFCYTLASSVILFSYLFVGLYQMKFSREHKEWTQWIYGLLAALFQFMCMILAGWQSVLVVSLSYIPGLIVYYQGVREQGRKLNKNEKITFIFIAILCVLSIVLIANKKINIM